MDYQLQSAHTHCKVPVPQEPFFPSFIYIDTQHPTGVEAFSLVPCARHACHYLRITYQVRYRLVLCLLRLSFLCAYTFCMRRLTINFSFSADNKRQQIEGNDVRSLRIVPNSRRCCSKKRWTSRQVE